LISPVLLKSQELGEQLGELPWLTVGSGLLNIGLNFVLIPPFGTSGAAVAMLTANLGFAVACYWRGRGLLHWPLPWKLLALTVAAMLLTGAIILGLPAPQGKLQCAGAFAGEMLLYLGICAVLLLALRPLFKDELDFVREIVRRRLTAG
jgi:O-antigen/teichoic acid export membrane protein